MSVGAAFADPSRLKFGIKGGSSEPTPQSAQKRLRQSDLAANIFRQKKATGGGQRPSTAQPR